MTAATSSHADRRIEWLSSIIMVGWCLVLAQRGDYLVNSHLHEFLRFGLSETQLAVVLGVVGMVRMGALYINGRWPRSPVLRMIGALVGLVIWGQVALMLWLAIGFSTGVAAYGPIAVFEFLSLYTAAFDARYHRL